ncbi:hypothetical protein Acr_21g0001100 [Actinidia rufa]|uniref:Uncharacterized protein n=1 Tax=Actinidia rufa TaxID=165716 RepID=A0A7J0GFH3_9ERIC|nr:hypothetical protein Acr_21g0001100 [Actinidia rufa]
MGNSRRMPNGDSTANVEDLVEMESQGYPIREVAGEINQFRIGNMRTVGGRGLHSWKSELIKTT